MAPKTTTQKLIFTLCATVISLFISSCSTQKKTAATVEKKKPEQNTADVSEKPPVAKMDTISIAEKPPVAKKDTIMMEELKNGNHPFIARSTKKYNPDFTPRDSVDMEQEYIEMLQPVSTLKSTNPDIYWFIVSWLNTHYHTPNWENYNTGEWKTNTKKTGIDCSGFARVMENEMFGRKIEGGSQEVLNKFCTRADTSSLTMGDLVFFRAPDAVAGTNDKIVHVGVYLMDRFFVHATSVRSAGFGKGLNISSLDEDNWTKDFVTGGKINNN